MSTTFAALGCREPFLAALEKRGFTTPTPVQAACFAPGLAGRDLLVQSRTGSGKTLAFGLPLLHRLTEDRHPQALILAPTRELAQQVGTELHGVMPKLPLASLVGGTSYQPQLKSLSQGAPVVVGTPGRVMDHLERGTLDLSKVSMVVLDECDEMLNMGFLEDVEAILAKVTGQAQTYLFSATLPAPIARLTQRFLKDPERIQLSEAGAHGSHADIAHTPVLVPDHLHVKALVNLLLMDEPSAALIFTKMKAQAEEVAEMLTAAGLPAAYLHGDLAQASRTRTLAMFKEGRLRYLVATDVAARGIDVEGLPLVVHMGIPTQMEGYIHRSGRTGRAGAKGSSLALVGWKESRILLAWSRRGGLKLDWRGVPTPAEIAAAQDARLLTLAQNAVSPFLLEEAQRLMAAGDPVKLVAGLLGLARAGRSTGYEVPNEPLKTGPKPAGKTFDRPYEKKSFDKKPYDKKPFEKKAYPAKPADRDEAPREFKKPWKPKADEPRYDKGPKRFEDRAHGPRKGESSFKPKDKRTGLPFGKKREG
ncbi:MAG TPA: DEAD/DEAH box helicase [Isosphaeraceae bacterium]|nr:DEAD/DEAH box helicase [Isosphaeraceae bacterium]